MSRLPGTWNGLPIPQALALLGAEGTDQADVAVVTAPRADDDLILVNVGRHRIPAVAGIPASLHVPKSLAGCRIERDHATVLGSDEDLAIGEANATIRGKQQDICRVICGLPK